MKESTFLKNINSPGLKKDSDEKSYRFECINLLQKIYNEKHFEFEIYIINWLEKLDNKSKLTLMDFCTLKAILKKMHNPSHQEFYNLSLTKYLKLFYFQNNLIFNVELKLPKKFLLKCCRKDVLFYFSISRKKPKNKLDKFLILVNESSFKYYDIFFAFIFIIFLYTSSLFLYFTAGACLGYLVSTCIEWVVHRHIAHASPQVRKKLFQFGKFGQEMLRFNLEHSLHHKLVLKNYVNNFHESFNHQTQQYHEPLPTDQILANKFILNKGDENLLKYIKQSRYGLSSSNTARTMISFLPISILFLLSFIHFIPFNNPLQAVTLFIGYICFSEMWILTSAIYHPYLHYTEEQINKYASPILKYLLFTRISRFISRSHRMHHASGGIANQNLNLGFDFLKFWIPIECEELIDLELKNVPY